MTRSAKNALSSTVVPIHVIMLVLHVGDIIGERERYRHIHLWASFGGKPPE